VGVVDKKQNEKEKKDRATAYDGQQLGIEGRRKRKGIGGYHSRSASLF
jgi:hypothetical protein